MEKITWTRLRGDQRSCLARAVLRIRREWALLLLSPAPNMDGVQAPGRWRWKLQVLHHIIVLKAMKRQRVG